MKEGYVLYVDHTLHPAPLSLCYHATGARHLSSFVERYPPATQTEVDSAYCPQCLSYHDSSSAARMGFCNKPSCAQCPLCQNVCAVRLDKSLLFYQCGACNWTSRECNLTVELADAENLGRLEYARALEDLGTALKQRRTSEEDWQAHGKNLSHAWEQRLRQSKIASGAHRELRLSRQVAEGWSVETLEASIKDKRQAWAQEDNFLATKLDIRPLQFVSLDEDPKAIDEAMKEITSTAVQLQLLNRPDPIRSRSEMLPLPIPLRPRFSLRCRKELAQGRPGILLKPKLNPLEGDSSLRSGHGQWYKKDSSAILVMPRVRVIDFDVSAERSAFLLKVTNPTLGSVQLRFAASDYQGEYGWDKSDKRESAMKQLLVDELMQTYLNVDLKTDALHDMPPTEVVELSSDPFIEFGGKAREIPNQVQGWKAPDGVIDSAQLRLVASHASTVWFELLTRGLSSEKEGFQPGIPIAMEVKVGNGSWESSLIPQQKEKDDFVSFDIVLTWPA